MIFKVRTISNGLICKIQNHGLPMLHEPYEKAEMYFSDFDSMTEWLKSIHTFDKQETTTK